MTNNDPVWEQKYATGHAERWPWDMVVSFVFRHAPRGRPRAEVRILEVGCGSGSNLWFAAHEGFRVAGIDGSASAIGAARARFAADGLDGDFHVADFSELPFADTTFDLVVDRGALTCVGTSVLMRALAEVRRVLKPGGRLLFNPYGDSHSSLDAGRLGADGLTVDIAGGTLTGVGGIRFTSRRELLEWFTEGWQVLSLQRLELTDMHGDAGIHAEWRLIAERCEGDPR